MEHLRQILNHFPDLEATYREATVQPMAGGLINDTFAVGDAWVLQRLHPIFAAPVNHDIVALTAHLRAAGVTVPRLLHTASGDPFVTLEGDREGGVGGVWRVMSRLPGRTQHQMQDGRDCASAAELVARFHAALAGVGHDFHFTRPGAHDTQAHMNTLRAALASHPSHRLYDEVARLAARIFSLWQGQTELAALPLRIGHGDLKASNLLFAEQSHEATAVIDLDTMAWMTMDVELGDALRSWCNRSAEDAPEPKLDTTLFEAAMRGYARGAGAWMTTDERNAIVPGLLRISTELSARFAADALHERYFGWNPAAAPTRGAHNLMRSRNQLQFAEQVSRARPKLEALVRAAFSAG